MRLPFPLAAILVAILFIVPASGQWRSKPSNKKPATANTKRGSSKRPPVRGRASSRGAFDPTNPLATATPTATPTPRPTATPIPTPTATAVPQVMFPFALPPFDGTKTATDLTYLNEKPAGASGFIRTQGEHFVNGSGRVVRFWGVNLNFSGVFPPKQDASRIAARLAKFGFNAARIHHYEGYVAPNGLWKPASFGSGRPMVPRQMDEEQLDRFDYFVSELIKNGIYINLNLHVGRKIVDGEGVPSAARLPEKDKGVNYYNPQLLQLQRDFSKQILTHVNPYTQKALKDDPALCAVEVANENSLLGMWLDGSLSRVIPEHAQLLQDRWNKWLDEKYSEASLRAAWTEISTPLEPANMLQGPQLVDVINPNAPDAMAATAQQTLSYLQLATVTGASGKLETDVLNGPTVDGFVRPGIVANLYRAGTVSWAFQINRDSLDLRDNQPYTLIFWARANAPRQISVNAWQDRAPSRFLGFTGYANLTTEWKKFSYTFRPAGTDPQHSRLSWNLGNQTGTIQLGEIELHSGGRIAAPDEWTLTSGVPLIDFKNTPVWVARRDFAEFLGSVEAETVTGYRNFLRNDVGVRCPIWHTQAQFGGWGGVQREALSDAVDVHAYWKHPDFGGAAWSTDGWTVGNASMTTAAATDPLSGFAMFRMAGKPFVMTEWNAGQPNDFGGEALPMAAAYAAWQDWAALYVFDYHSAGPYDRKHFEGFFSIDTHPTKMASAITAALMFRRGDGVADPNSLTSGVPTLVPGDLQPSQDDVTLTIPNDTLWHEVASSPGPPTAATAIRTWLNSGAARESALLGKTYVRLGPGRFPTVSRASSPRDKVYESDTRQIAWDSATNIFTVNTDRSKAAIGFMGGKNIALDEWRISMPRSVSNYAALSLATLDSKAIPSSSRILLTATGNAENVGMGWNAQRNSVGTQWGMGPTRTEGIVADIEVLTELPTARVWALNEKGERRQEVPSRLQDGVLRFSISSLWQTLWYEIAPA